MSAIPDMESENVKGCELMMGCRLICKHHSPLLAEPCGRCPRRANITKETERKEAV